MLGSKLLPVIAFLLVAAFDSADGAPDMFSLNDAYSLVAMKKQIFNDPYAATSNWKVDPTVGHACFWNGVKCASLTAYRVTSLDLSKLGLIGTIAANIGALSELQSLNISYNGFTGSIPTALGTCVKLTVLDLSHNAMSGVIPTEFASLTGLQKLYMGYNEFVGTLMFPSSMTNLTEFSVEFNKFNGYPLSYLVSLTELVYLNLRANDFAGTLDSQDLLNFKVGLKQLLLGSNHFIGVVPISVSYLVNLEKLDLANNNLTGAVPPELQSCANLVYLNISYNQLSDDIPLVFNKLLSLSVLDLRGNRLNGTINAGVLGCTNLTDLRLGENQLNGSVPPELQNLKSLNYLDLSRNFLTGALPAELTSLPLTTLNVSGNQLIGSLGDVSPSIVELDLSENNFTGGIPDSYSNLASLQALSLAYNRLTGHIPTDLGKSKQLKKLNVSGNFLTGPIPPLLATLNLAVFTVANNMLSGKIPDTSMMRSFSPDAFAGNPDLCGAVIRKTCPTQPLPTWATGLLATIVPIGAVLLAALLLAWWFRRGDYPGRTIRRITDDFSSSHLIGVGGTCAVYKGVFPNGETVAVKRLRPEYYTDRKRFNLERKLLLDVNHPNVVRVLGSCSDGRLKALVLEYMPNGNLDMHLYQGSLPWRARMDIAAGVAQALAYLHGEWRTPHTLHPDLKGSSVLLDERFNAHITDIRLAIYSPEALHTEPLGYMPPG